jgi:hypothetical protein
MTEATLRLRRILSTLGRASVLGSRACNYAMQVSLSLHHSFCLSGTGLLTSAQRHSLTDESELCDACIYVCIASR